MRRLAPLALLAAALGCATLPPCPARGGPAWTRWTSAHVTLYTDLDDDDAKSALHDFEELRAAVLLAVWRRAPEPPGRVVVFDLRSWREGQVFIPGGDAATFVVNAPLRQAFIVKSGGERDAIVTQALVISLSYDYGLLGKAAWFDEGLYRYLGPLRVDPDGKVRYGQVDTGLLRNVTRGGLTSFENLWEPSTPQNRPQFQATSWLVVHYLFNNEAERFATFQSRLIETKNGRAAWREVFPDLTADVMDERLAAYVFREGRFATYEADLQVPPAEVTSTPVSDATVHATRALLYATSWVRPTSERPALVRAELSEALRLDPTLALAVYVQRFFLHEDETDLELPKRVVALHPDDATAWLVLARARLARHETVEGKEALEQFRALTGGTHADAEIDLRVARPD
jgi:hypothetical protein